MNSSCGFVMAFLAAVVFTLIEACPPGSGTSGHPPASEVSYVYLRGGTGVLEVITESSNRHMKRSSGAGAEYRGISAANIFLEFDVNNDDVIDACEWMTSGHATRIKHYVTLLEDVDLDGNDTISLEEFVSVKIVVKAPEE